MSEVVDETNVEDAAYLAEMAAPEIDAEVPVAEAPKEAEPAEVAAVAEPAVPERKEVISGYTEEEIRAALAHIPALQKAIDTTNGTYGARLAEQQRVIEELKQQRQAISSISPGKLSRMAKEFPEIAEMLEADLSEVSIQGNQAFDPTPLQREILTLREEMVQKERNLEIKALNRQHPDWKEVAAFESLQDGSVRWANPQFGQWVNSQPADVQQNIREGWDADYISSRLSEFKAATKPKAAAKKALDIAVLPRGLGGVVRADSEDDEEAAYRAEMARN